MKQPESAFGTSIALWLTGPAAARWTRYELEPREYFLLAPPRQTSRSQPLLVALHGGGSQPLDFAAFTRLADSATARGWMVALPAGTGPIGEYLTWNAGRCCGHAERAQTDDVGFVQAVVDQLLATHPIDRQRVYAAGFSNGGMLAYRLAVELPATWAAVGVVAGAMVCDRPTVVPPVPLAIIHGTADTFVRYEGGRGAHSLRSIDFPGLEPTIDWWQASNRTRPASSRRLIVPTEHALGVIQRVYAAGPGGCEVRLAMIEGGGHVWPGAPPTLPLFGASTLDFDANAWLLDFFARHATAAK